MQREDAPRTSPEHAPLLVCCKMFVFRGLQVLSAVSMQLYRDRCVLKVMYLTWSRATTALEADCCACDTEQTLIGAKQRMHTVVACCKAPCTAFVRYQPRYERHNAVQVTIGSCNQSCNHHIAMVRVQQPMNALIAAEQCLVSTWKECYVWECCELRLYLNSPAKRTGISRAPLCFSELAAWRCMLCVDCFRAKQINVHCPFNCALHLLHLVHINNSGSERHKVACPVESAAWQTSQQ